MPLVTSAILVSHKISAVVRSRARAADREPSRSSSPRTASDPPRIAIASITSSSESARRLFITQRVRRFVAWLATRLACRWWWKMSGMMTTDCIRCFRIQCSIKYSRRCYPQRFLGKSYGIKFSTSPISLTMLEPVKPRSDTRIPTLRSPVRITNASLELPSG